VGLGSDQVAELIETGIREPKITVSEFANPEIFVLGSDMGASTSPVLEDGSIVVGFDLFPARDGMWVLIG
jgi:hypothetical protein